MRLFLIMAAVAPAAHAAQLFVAIPPCRVLDTRFGGGGFFVPPFSTVRTYDVAGTTDFSATGVDQGGDAACTPIPTTATAVSFNFVAVGPEGPGHMTAWPAGDPEPTASTINYSASGSTGGLNIANGVIVPITPGAGGNLDVRAHINGIHLVADATGYFIDLDVTQGIGITVTNPAGPDPGIAIAPRFRLPQACNNGDLVSWDTSLDPDAFTCVAPGGTGTLTGVGQGTGIAVDNTDPAVPVVSVATPYQLPQTGCASGEVVTSNGSGGWSCEPDGGGTVTGVGQGTGTSVDNTNPAVPVVSVATPYQLPQAGCATGEVVTSDGSGGWSCEPVPTSGGTLTGVGAGTGIAVDNTNPTVPVVSVTTPYQLPQAGCASGEVVTSNGSGGWSCEPVIGGGAGTLSKNNIYVNTQGGGSPAVGAFSRTASCNDANDIALSGFCRSTGNDVVVLLSQDALNFNTNTLTAQFTCRFRNESNGNGQAGIVCLTVPGP